MSANAEHERRMALVRLLRDVNDVLAFMEEDGHTGGMRDDKYVVDNLDESDKRVRDLFGIRPEEVSRVP